MGLVFDLDHDHGLPPGELRLLVGGKAANLAVMASELRFPVPPGFVVSTGACRSYLRDGWPAGLDEELRAHMRRLEELAGRRFGAAADPLLVSVRSGAPVSMPGMMDTILNLGLNEQTSAGLARASGDALFAQDCRNRFRLMFKSIVGQEPSGNVWSQLRAAIGAVFLSWNSERATAYRDVEGISGEFGTAVTVQAMVFGNSDPDSATGVLFTRDPATGERAPFGDVLFEAQGEDVVAGTRRTYPVAALDQRMPGSSGSTRTSWSGITPTCVTSSSRSSGAGCGCCRSVSASAARSRPCASRWTWPATRNFRSPGTRRSGGWPPTWSVRPASALTCRTISSH